MTRPRSRHEERRATAGSQGPKRVVGVRGQEDGVDLTELIVFGGLGFRVRGSKDHGP